MARKAAEMTALELKSKTAPGLYFVGGVSGLALQVLPSGGRSWVLRMMIGSKRRDMGLGGFPDVTLAGAREAARAAREKVRQGIDPIEEGRAARSTLKATQAGALTFKQCAEKYMAAHEAGWKNIKHGQQWRNTLENYAIPVMGSLLVRDVGLSHVLEVLEPIWKTKTETASRLRGRIEQVLDWATARNYRDGQNPARWRGHLDKLLAAPGKVAKVEHHEALPAGDMGAFMLRLRAAEGMGARALEFVILTATRSGEVRGATWAEIDRDAKVWTVPAARMKAGKEHRVPLSDAALALIDKVAAMPRLAGTEYVFQAPRGGVLSDMTLTAVLRRMEVPAVPHGFRSTFRDWAGERTTYPNEVCEMALAHAIGSKVEAAYRRGDMFDRRRAMMADWASFIAKIEGTAKVIDMQSKRA
jgi:integrase